MCLEPRKYNKSHFFRAFILRKRTMGSVESTETPAKMPQNMRKKAKKKTGQMGGKRSGFFIAAPPIAYTVGMFFKVFFFNFF